MNRFTSRKAVASIVAGLAVAGAGTAVAASGSGSGTSFLDRVAQKLGISSEKLQDATRAAALDQIQAELDDGTITKDQADRMKERVESGDMPFFGSPGGRGDDHGRFGRRGGPGGPGIGGGHLADAATYLGLTEEKLVEQLRTGSTLAEVAKAQGKGVDGLKAALLASEKKELDALVKDGEITQAQADSALADRKEHLDDIVDGTFGGPGMGRGPEGDGDHHRFGGHGDDDEHGPVTPGGELIPGGASLGEPA